MSKKFLTRVEEIKANVKNKGFSKADFTDLMLAYINDPELTTETFKAKGDNYIVTKHQPVKEFRKMIKVVLKDMGMEEAEAQSFVDNYEFKKVDALFQFMNDFIYYYMKTGRKYDLASKEDLNAKIYLKEKGDVTKEVYKKDDKGNKVLSKRERQDAYYGLGQQSSCPKWKKKIVDDSGKVLKEMTALIK